MNSPNTLTEALVGLCVLAAKGGMTDAEIRRLVEQFLAQYPEIVLAPTWSKTLPTEPGFYWLGSPVPPEPVSPDIVSVEVDLEGGPLMVGRIGDEGGYPIERNRGDLWAGPLLQPPRPA